MSIQIIERIALVMSGPVPVTHMFADSHESGAEQAVFAKASGQTITVSVGASLICLKSRMTRGFLPILVLASFGQFANAPHLMSVTEREMRAASRLGKS